MNLTQYIISRDGTVLSMKDCVIVELDEDQIEWILDIADLKKFDLATSLNTLNFVQNYHREET